MKKLCMLVTGVIIVTASLWQTPVMALEISWTGQPDNFPLNMRSAAVTGFGDFTFGMSVEQVEQLVRATWPHAQPERQQDPVQRTTLLTFNLDNLTPVPDAENLASPGPATLTYVFGYRSQQLMGINLDWYAEGNASDEQRRALLEAGSIYTALMLGDNWPLLHSSRGHIMGPGILLLFAGRDIQGRGVEVRVHGIAMDVLQPDGETIHRPAPAGSAQLHIGLSAMPDEPDVFRLPDNSF